MASPAATDMPMIADRIALPEPGSMYASGESSSMWEEIRNSKCIIGKGTVSSSAYSIVNQS